MSVASDTALVLLAYDRLTDRLTVSYEADPVSPLVDEVWSDVWVTLDEDAPGRVTSVVVYSSRFARPDHWYGAVEALLGTTATAAWLSAASTTTGAPTVQRHFDVSPHDAACLSSQWLIIDRAVRRRFGLPLPPLVSGPPCEGDCQPAHMLAAAAGPRSARGVAASWSLELPAVARSLRWRSGALRLSDDGRLSVALATEAGCPEPAPPGRAALFYPDFRPLDLTGKRDGALSWREATRLSCRPAGNLSEALVYLNSGGVAADCAARPDERASQARRAARPPYPASRPQRGGS